MAIAWLSVLKMVPWGEVISNAPKVADGAKKLWQTVGKQPAAAPAEPGTAAPAAGSTPEEFQGRLAATEAAVAELHQQMLASSELIQALAQQNAQLIRRVEALRLWMRALAVAAGLGLVVAAVSLGWALTRL
ncbi:MAG: hypothetical protein OEY75_07815 [Hylemonella sp.]|nr:hypothetical protein [Hylemonella sp.]MDH5709010.1 hypothetical protein [Hylemonella sp.]